MFERSRCRRCGYPMKRGWNYCPECGMPVNPGPVFKSGDDIFKGIERMINTGFSSPGSRPVQKGGISITIRRSSDSEPKVDVRTTGDYRRLEPEIRKSVGAPKKVPKGKVEEPVADVKKSGSRVEISLDLPGTKEGDVEVTKLENSLEVRAYSDDKTYFKLIPVPRGAEMVEKKFRDGRLEITLES